MSLILQAEKVFEGDDLAALTDIGRAHTLYIRLWIFTPAPPLLFVRLILTKGSIPRGLTKKISVLHYCFRDHMESIKGRRDYVQKPQLRIFERSLNSLVSDF